MAELNKRQKILIIIVVIAVIGAVVDRFVFSKKKPAVSQGSATSSFNLSEVAQVSANQVPQATLYALELAKKPWQRNIFAIPDKKLSSVKSSQKSQDPASEPEFKYTGVVDTGKKKIAIINGIEYAEGDLLDSKGIYLKKIFADRVIIENRPLRTDIEVAIDASETVQNQTNNPKK